MKKIEIINSSRQINFGDSDKVFWYYCKWKYKSERCGLRRFVIYVLCDLVPFVLFKKREKHPWRSVTFSKVAG